MATVVTSPRRPQQRSRDEHKLSNSDDTDDRELIREEFLREEIRSLQALGLTIMRWGVTVLVSVQTALFFVRRNVAGSLAENIGEANILHIPLRRYLMGTLFLVLLAAIFTRLTTFILSRLAHYRNQLMDYAPSGIQDMPARPGARKWVFFLYFVFPLTDLLFRAYLTFGLK